MKLQIASRITFRGVNALRRHDQRHLMRIEFIDQLRKVRKTAAKPIQFEANDHINPSTPNCLHKPIKAFAAALSARNHIADSSTSVQPRRMQYSRRS